MIKGEKNKKQMKKNITTWLTATLILLSLNHCASTEECLPDPPPITGGEPELLVRVVDNPKMRNSAPVPPGSPLVLNEGTMYLVNADGMVVEHFAIVSANSAITVLTPEHLAKGIIHRNLLDNGVVLPGVAGNVAEVVMVGNTSGTAHTGDVNGEFIGGRLLNAAGQHDVRNLNLFGRRAVPATVNPSGYYAVEVHLAPTVARMELPSITGTGTIADFTVDGVFINHYHLNATVDGAIPGINTPPNLRSYTDAAAFSHNAPNTDYTAAAENALYYWNATANFDKRGLTVRPSDQQTNVFHPNTSGGGTNVMRDHVWGFQVFARNYGELSTPDTEAPRLVIRLSNIKLMDGRTIDGVRFVTVGALYRRENGSQVPVTHVRASDVYHIVNGIVFDEKDLSTIPNMNEIEAEVLVKLAAWGGGDVYQGGVLRQPNPPETMRITFSAGGVVALGAAYPGGDITYQWQMSTNEGVMWTDVAGATAQNLTIPAATMNAPALFRRIAMADGQTIATTAVRVHQAVPLTTPHPAPTTVYTGATHTFHLGVATGGSGTITYQWQTSANGTTWTNIGGATNAAYTTPALTANTYFRRVATSGSETVASNGALVTVVVLPTSGALIGGVRWATRNVELPGAFAANPQAFGRYFQWGTIGGATHHWATTGAASGWNNSNNRVAWTAANQPCPSGWRLPTQAELERLGTGTWHVNWNGTGVNGRVYPAGATAAEVMSVAPTAIFLPAAGWRSSSNGVIDRQGGGGSYWSSGVSGEFARYLWFNSDRGEVMFNDRALGFSVRCVQ